MKPWFHTLLLPECHLFGSESKILQCRRMIPRTMIHEDDGLFSTQDLSASLMKNMASSSVPPPVALIASTSYRFTSMSDHMNTCSHSIFLIWSHPLPAIVCLRIRCGSGRTAPTFLYHFLTDT